MLQIAQDFFKRNKKAKACHVVLDNVFESLQSAKAYQQTISAHCVTSYLKKKPTRPTHLKGRLKNLN